MIAFAVLLFVSTGAGAPAEFGGLQAAQAEGLYYQNAQVRLPRIDSNKARRYRSSIVAASQRGRIRSVTLRQASAAQKNQVVLRRGGQSAKLRRLPLAAQGALAYLSGPRYWGAELDLLVRVRGAKTTPVSLRFDRDGDVVVEVGRPLRSERPGGRGKRTDLESIQRTHGTGAIGPSGRWSKRDLRILDGVLSGLPKEEKRVLRKLRFRKLSVSGRSPLQTGLYEMDSRGRYTLKLFRRAFRSETTGFAGRPEDPRSRLEWTLLHELGHAVALWEARQAFERGDFQRGRRLQRNNRVLRGYRKALGGKLGPTPYGRRSTMESFAEAYALFYLDPEALRRFSGSVFDWFRKGSHRVTLKGSSR